MCHQLKMPQNGGWAAMPCIWTSLSTNKSYSVSRSTMIFGRVTFLQEVSERKANRAISPVRYVLKYIFIQNFWRFGKLYILETLWPTESEKQCLHFFQASYGSHLGFSKWRLFFLKSNIISASNYPRHIILVSKDAFLRLRNPVGQLKRC